MSRFSRIFGNDNIDIPLGDFNLPRMNLNYHGEDLIDDSNPGYRLPLRLRDEYVSRPVWQRSGTNYGRPRHREYTPNNIQIPNERMRDPLPMDPLPQWSGLNAHPVPAHIPRPMAPIPWHRRQTWRERMFGGIQRGLANGAFRIASRGLRNAIARAMPNPVAGAVASGIMTLGGIAANRIYNQFLNRYNMAQEDTNAIQGPEYRPVLRTNGRSVAQVNPTFQEHVERIQNQRGLEAEDVNVLGSNQGFDL